MGLFKKDVTTTSRIDGGDITSISKSSGKKIDRAFREGGDDAGWAEIARVTKNAKRS
jgi:hypothetical protein